jgi:hypothetical protein
MASKANTNNRIIAASPAVNSSRTRGTAMMETVLVLPLVFVVLAILFFFGQAMTRLQRSSVTDRYEAWRQTLYAPGPGAEFVKHGREVGGAQLLNEAFFSGNASQLDVADRSGRINVQEPTDLVAEATLSIAAEVTAPGYDAASAEDLVEEMHLRSPAWWRVDLSTEHTSSVPFYQRFAGPVRHQHTRIDGDWSFASWVEQQSFNEREDGDTHTDINTRINDILIDDVFFIGDNNDSNGLRDLHELRPQSLFGVYYVYYEGADEPLEALEQNGNPLAGSARGIYMNLPTYIGPQLLPELDTYLVRLITTDNPDPGQSQE